MIREMYRVDNGYYTRMICKEKVKHVAQDVCGLINQLFKIKCNEEVT